MRNRNEHFNGVIGGDFVRTFLGHGGLSWDNIQEYNFLSRNGITNSWSLKLKFNLICYILHQCSLCTRNKPEQYLTIPLYHPL
jgi:hypothetical protein